jgi:hypothetical protein
LTLLLTAVSIVPPFGGTVFTPFIGTQADNVG